MKLLNTKGSARTAIIVAVVTVAIIILGVWILGSSAPTAPSVGQPTDLPSPVTQDDWTKGSGAVALVEYSDFQCPACASYFPILKQITTEFSDSLTFTYRHFPLTSIHPNAVPAARAAEAAGNQGAFWEMHDILFQNQTSWEDSNNPEEDFMFYAEQIGINTTQFEQDYNSIQVRERVNQDRGEAVNAGINATPTFFLNGEKIQNPRSLEAFRALIEQAIEDASGQDSAVE